ncbi:MAG: excinuclease ABC subunit A [Planctomycetaceae bacterium]|nr:excinuclease ABC subunit A [Planctomycetaceae bacterium]
MPASDIIIKGAREHNLRNVDLVLPRNRLICLTGVSGSGKSSLAFDTLYAEGQRRYVESLSSFARQFLGQMPKPEVDHIQGLSPSISISQKSSGKNPRSTVGTITEIYDYLRVLFARVGQGFCPQCRREITAQTREQIIARILGFPANARFLVLAPLVRAQKGEYRELFEDLIKQGFVRARVNGEIFALSDPPRLDRRMKHYIEVVVDRLVVKQGLRPRLAEAVELGLKVGGGSLVVAVEDDAEHADGGDAATRMTPGRGSAKRGSHRGDIVFSCDYACTYCGISFAPPTPQLFSFNSPQGMCVDCDGLGELFSFDEDLLVPNGQRTFKQGALQTVGKWSEIGRWRRHIYQGVASTVERKRDLPEGTMLETAWDSLASELRDLWLWGTGEEHITFTWRKGTSPLKYGGTFDGVIPELQSKYRTSRSAPQRRQLEHYMRQVKCVECQGDRLNDQARSIHLTTRHAAFGDASSLSLPAVCQLPVKRAYDFFQDLRLDATGVLIAQEALKEIRNRLGFLMNVGLDYLTLNRTAPTLSGGESQRIRLAGQIGSGLVGVLYILDEPSIGLHPRDNARLLETLQKLRDMGNTVVVVEHDEDTIRAADHVVDFGPGPGVRGGEVVAEGPLTEILKAPRSLTGQFLSGKREISIPDRHRFEGSLAGDDPNGQPGAPTKMHRKLAPSPIQSIGDLPVLRIRGAAQNNLAEIDVEIPLGTFVCVTGVSGSGKSSLVNDIIVQSLHRDLNGGLAAPGKHTAIDGLDHLDKLISIDQSPIGRTPRSNPGTYIKVFDEIRKLYAKLPESKRRGYAPGRFSFNVSGGRCEACEGNGSNRLEMDFLADVWVTCSVCEGHRYNRETLQVTFKEHSIADVLEMDVQQLLDVFENVPQVKNKLQTLHAVGLDYLKLGQPSPTLSGGEAQRIKLARELVKKPTGRTLYVLDEPTTGLHFADIQLLLDVLHGFVNTGNTVVVVEHNLDVIKTADWIIDLGPDGGDAGGRLVAAGTPVHVAAVAASHTGCGLQRTLSPDQSLRTGRHTTPARRRRNGSATTGRRGSIAKRITVQGATQHNLNSVDAEIHRDKMTVFCGPSGSGKTSLAMDTIYAEGQRRYVESLSSYARQFVNQVQKPALDHIEGLSPAIAIEQKNLGHTPRSTVGTVTEIYDYLRILMSRLGTPYCPDCDLVVGTQTGDEIIDKIMNHAEGTRLFLMAPVEVDSDQQTDTFWNEMRTAGYVRIRVDGRTYPVENAPAIDRRQQQDVDVVIDRVIVRANQRSRIADSVENALAVGRGVLRVAVADERLPEHRWEVVSHSQHLACDRCGRSFERLSPHNFSFNSHLGWCPSCEGLGTQTGANPNALLNDEKWTLAEGAVRLWPDVRLDVSQWMLNGLSEATGVPLDVPFHDLSARQRRVIMHGTGSQWLEVYRGKRGARGRKSGASRKSRPLFRFQFKGLYPALEEASRLSPAFRTRLEQFIDEVACSSCAGARLRDDAAAARFRKRTIDELCRLPLGSLLKELQRWRLSQRDSRIVGEVVREIKNRVQFLVDVGLDYVSLARGAATLSNGEAQRIRLASQLGSGLCGVLYVLDEPTIGLHPRDNHRLLSALYKLRDLGNTLLLIEHDREVIEGSDYLSDFGPGAGKLGGHIVATGTPRQLARSRKSVTGPYLSGKKSISVPSNRRSESLAAAGLEPDWLGIRGARHNNLCGVDAQIPLGMLTAVTGPSGSGKSSLIDDILYRALSRRLHRASHVAGAHDAIEGIEHINKVIRVDQTPLGNSPTSNPATYTGVFELIRMLFAQLPQSKLRGYSPRRFSFNVPGGRCENCEGNGQICIEMHFLPDVWVECDSCQGKRYNPETLAIQFHGSSISDVLDATCREALVLFQNIPKIRRVLETLCAVGLDYLRLGQAAPTLSGGEAQRVKLSAELSRPDTGRTLYLLDEPTTGLHFDDLRKLLDVLHRLIDLGNTVVVIEHNLDVIKQADWVIDLGPEAGSGGGQIVAAGTPEMICREATDPPAQALTNRHVTRSGLVSHTAVALAPVLAAGPHVARPHNQDPAAEDPRPGDMDIADVGKNASMPWQVDGRRWHTRDRVGRRGEATRWDGHILEHVVDRIHELGDFSATDWNGRGVVEIAATKKSEGWFFHAITGEAWLLKMKFRTARNTFQRSALEQQIPLKTLNQLDEVPLYSNESRVKVKNARGPFQEVELRVHTWEEIDCAGFWDFLEQAVRRFEELHGGTGRSIDDFSPWKKLGRKWHFMRKGFSPGRSVKWKSSVLEELVEILTEVAPQGEFLWNNQVQVNLCVSGQREPWARLLTKRHESLDLVLTGPKNQMGFGRVAELGRDREFDDAKPGVDHIRLKFRTLSDLRRGDLRAFLGEHLRGIGPGSDEV